MLRLGEDDSYKTVQWVEPELPSDAKVIIKSVFFFFFPPFFFVRFYLKWHAQERQAVLEIQNSLEGDTVWTLQLLAGPIKNLKKVVEQKILAHDWEHS